MVVALDELGHLTCCYLGTDPSIFSSGTASRELNYEVRVQTCYASLWRVYESILLCSLLSPFVSSEEPFLAPSSMRGSVHYLECLMELHVSLCRSWTEK